MDDVKKREFVELFLQRVQLESNFSKYLDDDLITQFIQTFPNNYPKISYPKEIEDPFTMALSFYQYYNPSYYEMILEGIRQNFIVIEEGFEKSFVDTENHNTYIRLLGNDADLFLFVHEFAHFIDRNSTPAIIPETYYFLGEAFAFYMEKQLESWLDYSKYHCLIEARRNNRMYFEARMLKAVDYQMLCESSYKKFGQVKEEDLDFAKIQLVIGYDYDLEVGLINYLLCYPLANVLSDYLMYSQKVKSEKDIASMCLDANLNRALSDFKVRQKIL